MLLSQEYLALPVGNGMLPRPGGSLTAVFLSPWLIPAIAKAGTGTDIFLVVAPPGRGPYPVGIIAQIREFWLQEVFVQQGGQPEKVPAVFLRLFGRALAKAEHFRLPGRMLLAIGVAPMNLVELRPEYPCISAAGSVFTGGFTESRGPDDVRIHLQGQDIESGSPVFLEAILGDLISYQQAHTIEHAIIRSLQLFSFCSPKTLREAMEEEGEELMTSIEAGISYNLPELFGLTQSGACGNPLTNLAKIYLAEEYLTRLQAGMPLLPALDEARRHTLSRLTSDLSLTTQAGLRTLQGLKHGMMHDHTPLSESLCKRILNRFPATPWA